MISLSREPLGLYAIVVPQLSGGWQHKYSTKTRYTGCANEQSMYTLMSVVLCLAWAEERVGDQNYFVKPSVTFVKISIELNLFKLVDWCPAVTWEDNANLFWFKLFRFLVLRVRSHGRKKRSNFWCFYAANSLIIPVTCTINILRFTYNNHQEKSLA
jgi:hypothetical protein